MSDGVQCLNLLVTSTIKLIPDVLEYMSLIKNQSIFNFCAIPQVTQFINGFKLYSSFNR